MTEALRTNLGAWENPPLVQDQIIAYMVQINAPMLLREVYRPLGLPREIANRVLCRLHKKGFLKRRKFPVSMHRPGQRGHAGVAAGATRQCFLYSFAEQPGE